MEPIRVDERTMKYLESLQGKQTGQPSAPAKVEAEAAKRDVAGEVWDTTKKVGKWYLGIAAVWAVIVLILAVIVGSWVVSGINQIQQSNAAAFSQASSH